MKKSSKAIRCGRLIDGLDSSPKTDFVGSPITEMRGENAMELELLVKHCELTPMEAIIMVTANSAKACGLERNTGTIEPGKKADIITIDGDLLKDISILRDATESSW